MEHVKPLSEALDWLAGDPGAIAGHAQTWRNVAASVRAESDQLVRAVRFDLAEWQGLPPTPTGPGPVSARSRCARWSRPPTRWP
ncbi:hypothetical protein [Paractinoplanes durhamensis]|uniref:hypothetical protein n=1 Tax=Paractinoplanes durhamensis TaxID=113563 RepID=UPI0036344418